MYDLQELYQDMVIDHNSRPRNFRKVACANRVAEGFNPLCGDSATIYLRVDDGVIADVGFQAAGCAISMASSSMMTESIKGKTMAEAQRIFDAFRRMVTRNPGEEVDDVLGDLEILRGISAYPARIKCATLSWHALQAAMNGDQATSSTE